MTDGDDEIPSGKQVGFPCLDVLIPQLHGSHGNKQMFTVFLDFGALLGGNGIFQRELVQAEFFSQPGDGLAVGRFQFDPDETVEMGNMLADVVKRNRLDFGILEEQAVDDAPRSNKELSVNSSL
jgi:hypothetical protein